MQTSEQNMRWAPQNRCCSQQDFDRCSRRVRHVHSCALEGWDMPEAIIARHSVTSSDILRQAQILD